MYSNSIGPEGAKYISEALAVNKTLTSLEYAAGHPFSYCQHRCGLEHLLGGIVEVVVLEAVRGGGNGEGRESVSGC